MIGPQWTKFAIHAVIVAASLACLPLAKVAIAASGAYDGAYRGETTLTRGDDPPCGRATYPVSWTVVNGQFSIVWDPVHHVGVNVEVQTDGSFSGNQQYTVGSRQAQLKATGHIADNVLEADVDGSFCTRHYHLTKIR